MTFSVVALNTQAKTAKLTLPPSNPSRPAKMSSRITSFSAWGALTTNPYKLRQPNFFLALVVQPPWLRLRLPARNTYFSLRDISFYLDDGFQ